MMFRINTHLVTDLEDKIILRGIECYGSYWGFEIVGIKLVVVVLVRGKEWRRWWLWWNI